MELFGKLIQVTIQKSVVLLSKAIIQSTTGQGKLSMKNKEESALPKKSTKTAFSTYIRFSSDTYHKMRAKGRDA